MLRSVFTVVLVFAALLLLVLLVGSLVAAVLKGLFAFDVGLALLIGVVATGFTLLLYERLVRLLRGRMRAGDDAPMAADNDGFG